MTIHLSEDLRRFVQDQVESGHYRSEDDVIRDALEHFRTHQRQSGSRAVAPPSVHDPLLGLFRDAPDEMDEIVAEAMRHRREDAWRDIDLE
jgi:putative addiction module CopG family antidote